MAAAAWLLACALSASTAPPLGVASLAPGDVDAVIQIRGGLRTVEGAGSHMLHQAAAAVMRSVGAAEAWQAAATSARMKPDQLLDRCAGRDASLVVRQGQGGMEWVLALEITPGDACELLKAFNARVTGSRRFEIPSLGLVGSRHREWLLVADDPGSPLLRDMHVVGCEGGMPSLAETLPLDPAQGASAAIMVALRHQVPVSGRSVWSITPTAGGLHVEVDGNFHSDLLGPVVDGPEPELALEAMPEETVACWMQPMPVQPVPEALRPLLAEGRVPQAVRDTLGGRMAVIVGPGKFGPVSVAVAYEVRDAASASEAQDALLLDMAARADVASTSRRFARSARRLESPVDFTDTGLGPHAFEAVEPASARELHARTVFMAQGGWRVYANERAWLARVVASLEEHPAIRSGGVGPPYATHSGFAQGGSLGRALLAWQAQRAARGTCGEGLRILAQWVSLTDLVQWRVAQTAPGRIRAVLEISPAIGVSDEPESAVAILP
jgi:hypothetical protein